MRSAFVSALSHLASHDDRVFLLTGDLGFRALEPFQERFPDRFINVGVAEQNMMGIATGLALEGYRPFVYSIASFVTTRCYEQFRIGAVLHGLPVRVVGIGAGYAYGHAGPTHYVQEDIAIMRAQPGVHVWVPCSPMQTAAAVGATSQIAGPIYLRIGKGGNAELCPSTEWRRLVVVEGGTQLVVITYASLATEVLAAQERLRESCIDVTVLIMQDLTDSQLLDTDQVRGKRVILVEETLKQNSVLGLFQTQLISASSLDGLFLEPRHVNRVFSSEADARRGHGLDAESIAARIRLLLKQPTESTSC